MDSPENHIAAYDKTLAEYKKAGGLEFDAANQEENTITFIFNTTAIEGNTFTRDQTATFLKTGQVIPGKSYWEHAEIQDSLRAVHLIRQFTRDQVPLSEGMVMALHREVLRSTEPEHAGKYKTSANLIGNKSTPYPEKARELYRDTLQQKFHEWKSLHPLQQGARLHYDTAFIHPFKDGNGRVARLLLNYVLLNHHYPEMTFRNSDKQQYYQALDASDQQKNYNPFEAYVINEARNQLQNKLDYLNEKKKEVERHGSSIWDFGGDRVSFLE